MPLHCYCCLSAAIFICSNNWLLWLLLVSQVGRQLLHSLPITLNGLLDYDDNDVEEELLELGLFAEGFQEMIMCDYGTSIYNFLLKDRYGQRRFEAAACGEADVLHQKMLRLHKSWGTCE